MDDMEWYYAYFGVTADESLAHYGVKGMKWGQRKERIYAGVRKYGGKAKEAAKARLKALGEQTVSAAKAAAAKHKQNRVEKKQDKEQEKQNAKMDKKINKMDNDPNYVKRMSDDELVAAIKRKKLEQEFESLNATPMNQFKKKVRNKASEVGANMVGKALETIGMGFINTAAAKVEQKQKIKKQQAEDEVKKRLQVDENKEIADIIDMMGGWTPKEAGKITSKDMNELMAMRKTAKAFNDVYGQTKAGKEAKKAWEEKKKADTPEGKKAAEKKAKQESEAKAQAEYKPQHSDDGIEKMAEETAARKNAEAAKKQKQEEKKAQKQAKKEAKQAAKRAAKAQEKVDSVLERVNNMSYEDMQKELERIANAKKR